MKTNKKILLASFSLVLIAVGVACTKGEAPDTPFTQMQGKWKKVQYATDDNNDGMFEQSEIHNVPSTLNDQILFTGADTGEETTVSSGVTEVPLSFEWKIVGGDSVWVAYQANDTLVYYIAQLSSHNLQLNLNTPQGLVGYFYAK